MSFCPRCGAEKKGDSDYCDNCKNINNNPKKNHSKSIIIGYSSIAVAALLIILCEIFNLSPVVVLLAIGLYEVAFYSSIIAMVTNDKKSKPLILFQTKKPCHKHVAKIHDWNRHANRPPPPWSI